MKASDVRKGFADFFIKHGHIKIDSSSLVPHNDPTLLFANAGMNQFKDAFTGQENPPNKRVVTIQKCVRAGGKHNDLENVGFTARHHTFFEMLGNFSFGDYFKKEAIQLAWKFLTQELKIPKDKLYVTVHETDQEAADIWHHQEGVPRERIFFMGDKDNFWEMGDVGPCGPCSEIFYDHGEKFSDGSDTSKCLLHDEGRYVEIWNLVFMQYEKYKDGNEIKRRNLPKPSVDTGAGLERLSAAIQGKYWNYDSDLFTPIINKITNLTGKNYEEKMYQGSIRVIADHIRSATMLITDGVIPSNEGRGYVLRRIIRRAIRHLDHLGLHETSFYKIVPAVFEALGEEYPDNKANIALAEKLLKLEEDKFRKTLATGLQLIEQEMQNLKPQSSFSGEIAFKLYDTYGFPIDLTQTICQEKNIILDQAGFEKAMAAQKEKSKKSSHFETSEDNLKFFYAIKENNGVTNFTGYSENQTSAKLIAKEEFGELTALVFDSTPFYAESGGQAGDSGIIKSDEGVLAHILDTKKPVEGLHVLYSKDADNLEIGTCYIQEINIKKRELIKRNHSATHLLQAALMQVLGSHVKQAGSMVSHERLRFDFTHNEALTKEQIKQVEKMVNGEIKKALPVVGQNTTKDKASEMGAMALFGEKYGENVRVISMGKFSCELCGGTHVGNTSEIGQFIITIETSLASVIRRIEAISSETAINYLSERSQILSEIEQIYSGKGDLLLNRIKSQFQDLKEKSNIIQSLKDQLQVFTSQDLFNNKTTLKNNVTLTLANASSHEVAEFRSLSDKFVESDTNGVVLIYKTEDDKTSFLLRTHKRNITIDLSEASKKLLGMIQGRGGGKPDMVQGSGLSSEFSKFIEALKQYLGDLNS